MEKKKILFKMEPQGTWGDKAIVIPHMAYLINKYDNEIYDFYLKNR